MLFIASFGLGGGETVGQVSLEPFAKLRDFYFVNIKLKLLLEILRFLILFSYRKKKILSYNAN